ncbi:Hsp70 family protein [Altererythrobacter sp. GH1-8]|uniref:Hsp70 family protein n=1 Tax=Altererythrobacter sp. GH1-8 TaxID=3349333 RepID=UPI00374D452B
MIAGIDLGTTNCAVAIWKDGKPELIPNALGDLLTPSAVSIDRSGQSWVGRAALDRMATHPEETVTSFKRRMGTQASTKLGKTTVRAEDLSAIMLRSMMDDVEHATGERPTEAVITVPAYFSERQRRATRRAGEIAGLDVKRLINEPTAAALAFGLHDREDREPFLVFDLGGGTFDVSIVEMFDGIIEVRASAGDNRLGGDDFNDALIRLVEPQLAHIKELEAVTPGKRKAMLTLAAEATRKALSSSAEADFAITLGDERHAVSVTTEAFEEEAAGLIKRLRDPVTRALRDSYIDAASLSEIVLVGGATRMPVVRKAITRMFGRFPNSTVHPDHAVALGAAIQAGLLSGGTDLEEIRVTDVAPFTLGIDVSDQDQFGNIQTGIFSPIIERNTPVPTSRAHSYSTMRDNQTTVEIGIYQGEARNVSNNIRLGDLKVKVPAKPAGQVEIQVRFTYDTSGLLEVDVDVPMTGWHKNLVIVDEEDKRSASEIKSSRAALEKLKVHPRDEEVNVVLLTRSQKLYEEFTGPTREAIGQWITQFTAVLEKQDPRMIADAREALTKALDEVEANPPI